MRYGAERREMSKRLEVLKQSLEKKQALFDSKLSDHYASVKQANGQPLNDKRNGQATLDRWNRQNEALQRIQSGIEITKQAIEREASKAAAVQAVALPAEIRALVESGELIQWRKHPNRFFVLGVDRARIVWDEEKRTLAHQYLRKVSPEQYPTFRDTFNKLRKALAQ
jgi:hypothetical protein